MSHGERSIPTAGPDPVTAAWPLPGRHALGRYNRGPMLRSLVRTIRGPSSDPRMDFISRPLPRGLTDEEVVSALELALERNPNPAFLVETLHPALRDVTGREYQVLDRSVRDVTGAFTKTMVMIRDGEVGLWPGYAARAYSLLDRSGRTEQARREIAAAEGGEAEPSPTNPAGKPGWAPPPPIDRSPPPASPVGDADAGASLPQGSEWLPPRESSS